MLNNIILGMGLNAFEGEDVGPSEPVDQVYTAPVEAVDANLLVVERNVAVEEAAVAVAEAELVDALVDNQTMLRVADTIDNVSASMEAYVEKGVISAEVATLLYGQLGSALESIGADMDVVMAKLAAKGIEGVTINGGLESFGDAEHNLAFFDAGLEALNDAKGTIGTKIAGALVGINQSMQRWIEGVSTKAGRLRKDAGEVIKDAQSATGSRTVKSRNKFLAVKADKPSANLVTDLANFTKVVTDLSSGYMAKVGSFANGQVNSALSQMKNVTKLTEAKVIVDKLNPPPYPGANVNIKDTPKLTLKRTDVTLGGYAVFELRYKTTGGDSANEIASQVKAIGMHRVSLKRPKEEKGGKVLYEVNHTPADAVAIANAVIKCCDAALAVQRNVKWTVPFFTAVGNHIKALETATLQSNSSAEKGVNTVVYTLCKLPSQMVDGVGDLVRDLPSAVTNVCEAALDVAKQAARGGSESSSSSEE